MEKHVPRIEVQEVVTFAPTMEVKADGNEELHLTVQKFGELDREELLTLDVDELTGPPVRREERH